MRPFRWSAVLELGIGAMRLAPAIFWAMSIPEWRAAVAARGARRAAPLARGEFERMMKEHPDG
ncbi:MAG TPA: phage tail assembly chaperone [Rhizomicrobium sp.]|nr:phage tail assembly chaperone [Rhizomicrobium sp.]